MRKYIIYISVLFLYSCASYNKLEPGIYKATGTDFDYTLKISDNKFELLERIKGANPTCNGVWNREAKGKIKLICSEEETLANQLSNSYMVQRVHYVKLKRKKIIYKNTVLKLQ